MIEGEVENVEPGKEKAGRGLVRLEPKWS